MLCLKEFSYLKTGSVYEVANEHGLEESQTGGLSGPGGQRGAGGGEAALTAPGAWGRRHQASPAASFHLSFVTVSKISLFIHTMVKYLPFKWKSLENRIYFDLAFLDHIYYIKERP